MSRFEYLSVLISIVIALGMSEIASTWSRLLRARARVDFYWLHSFWTVFMVLMMVQFWWGFWEFREVESWSFPGLVAVVTESLVLVLAAMALLPEPDQGGNIDLRSYYFAQCRVVFTLGALLLLLLTVVDALVGGQPFLHLENAVRLPAIILTASAALFVNERFHVLFTFTAAALFIGFLSVSYHA